ncbi:MAG: hypothetical protein HYU33_00255 [Candidatus Omnitrophica bacterium]|nr:hypothetical protein [Candidatus Omnitrophota bacterium]
MLGRAREQLQPISVRLQATQPMGFGLGAMPVLEPQLVELGQGNWQAAINRGTPFTSDQSPEVQQQARINNGVAHVGLGNLPAAVQDFEAAAAIDPTSEFGQLAAAKLRQLQPVAARLEAYGGSRPTHPGWSLAIGTEQFRVQPGVAPQYARQAPAPTPYSLTQEGPVTAFELKASQPVWQQLHTLQPGQSCYRRQRWHRIRSRGSLHRQHLARQLLQQCCKPCEI